MTPPKPPLKDACAIEIPNSIVEMGEEFTWIYLERLSILSDGGEIDPGLEETAMQECREAFERKSK